MSVIEIKVRNKNGEKVVYENSYMPVAKYREYLEMQAEIEDVDSGLSEAEKLDKQLLFIASLFENLSTDELYNGLEMAELNDIIGRVFLKLVGGSDDPKAKA